MTECTKAKYSTQFIVSKFTENRCHHKQQPKKKGPRRKETATAVKDRIANAKMLI